MSVKIKHILAIRLSAMGDVAIAVPVINSLRHQYPKLRISVLTKASFSALFKDVDDLEIIIADTGGEHKGAFGLRKLARHIKAGNPDAIADLHSVLRTQVLKFFLSGIAVATIDKGRREKKDLIKGKSFSQLRPSYLRYGDVFQKLGLKVNLDNPVLLKKQPVPAGFQSLFKDDQKVVGVAPIAAFEGKTYPREMMKILVEKLASRYKLILFGGPSDYDYLDELCCDGVVNLAGKTNMESELDLISNLDLMISMDSGNAHLAAMYGVKVLSLWGVTHPYAGFYPIGQPLEYALTADREQYPEIPTSVYGNKWPRGYEDAMRSISVDSIELKVKEILAQTS